MHDKADILSGTLSLMILRTLSAVGPLHGYALARRIEQISGSQLTLNQGTLYPALVRLEQTRWITAKWGESDTGRRVKSYAITRAGRRQLQAEEANWSKTAAIIGRFLKEDLT
jgi:PadR family transcriptional regulator, regulatory protein PadR